MTGKELEKEVLRLQRALAELSCKYLEGFTWISTKDKMPEEGQFLIFVSLPYVKTHGLEYATAMGHYMRMGEDEELDFYDTEMQAYKQTPEYWMPIPGTEGMIID